MTNARCLTSARVEWADLELTGAITKSFASLVRHVVGLFLTLETPRHIKQTNFVTVAEVPSDSTTNNLSPAFVDDTSNLFWPMYTCVKQT